ncbi:MAG: DUF3795 domain-containing protein [Actinobacteria bacterium]|nr:MAG: DUF3795 domain-containing protein [Actinomycetota bacterium]
MDLNNIAYCGLFCGGCPNHTGVIADLSRDLRKELRTYRFDKTAEELSKMSFFKEFKKYSDCYEVLGAMVKMRCKNGCRKGGGNPFCKIRKCAQKKELTGCWECGDFLSCDKLKSLEPNHGKAHIKNLKTLKKVGPKNFTGKNAFWYAV